MTDKTTDKLPEKIQEMFKVGAHFGLLRSRRHPSFKSLVCGSKNRTEIIDLEKTEEMLKKASDFLANLAKDKKTILFVSSKNEAMGLLKTFAEKCGSPFVSGRWIGGILTNFPEIKKRVARLDDLVSKKEKGELMKYTKKERLMFDREIESLTQMFSGLRGLAKKPDALFVVDPKKEHIAVSEAKKMNVPVVALASSDCDLGVIDYPIPANDSSKASIEFFLSKIAEVIKTA